MQLLFFQKEGALFNFGIKTGRGGGGQDAFDWGPVDRLRKIKIGGDDLSKSIGGQFFQKVT